MIIKFFRTIFPVILIITSAKISQAATPTMFWDIKSVKPLKEITFGITINAAAAIDEFYFANQFDFTHGGGIGYIGIQPTKNNKDNIRQFKVIFSSFRHDSSTQHKNCKQGADGMKTGVSCKIYIPGNLKDTFLFKVKKDGEILTGSVLNKSTGRVDVIGQWKIANSEGFLATSQVSWIENYLMNHPNYTLVCDKKGWPYYEVKFLPPIGNDKIQGNISGLSQGSKSCLGAIKWKNDKTGTLISGGYK